MNQAWPETTRLSAVAACLPRRCALRRRQGSSGHAWKSSGKLTPRVRLLAAVRLKAYATSAMAIQGASSIGLGTYLGDADERTDLLIGEACRRTLASGCNVIDTAINYRCQRSERVIGATVARLLHDQALSRDQVILCTKGGYLPFDGNVPRDPGRYLIDTFINPGLAPTEELVGGCHCLAPPYLDHALKTSVRNLHVETIDLYYLHNPEQQLDEVDRPTFLQRMEAAFAFLESRVAGGTIRYYGTATWNGYRCAPTAASYLSLQSLVQLAERVGGAAHHFRAIQLPYNLAMPEAFSFPNQTVDGHAMTVLDAAKHLGLSVMCSASLLQGRLANLPSTNAQRAVQFVRSTPGVTTALIGMKQPAHLDEILALAGQPLLSAEDIQQLFTRRTR